MSTKKRGTIVVLGTDLEIAGQIIKSGRYSGYVQWTEEEEAGETSITPLKYFIQVDADMMRAAGNEVPEGKLSLDVAVTTYVHIGVAWLEV